MNTSRINVKESKTTEEIETMDASDLTPELLAAYVKGQMEIQNQNEGYIFRGEVAEIAVENNALRIKFAWLAEGKGFPPMPTGWAKDENPDHLNYEASFEIFSINNLGSSGGEIGGGDRLSFHSPIVGEMCVLYPSDGSKLDPDKVEGLDLAEA